MVSTVIKIEELAPIRATLSGFSIISTSMAQTRESPTFRIIGAILETLPVSSVPIKESENYFNFLICFNV